MQWAKENKEVETENRLLLSEVCKRTERESLDRMDIFFPIIFNCCT